MVSAKHFAISVFFFSNAIANDLGVITVDAPYSRDSVRNQFSNSEQKPLEAVYLKTPGLQINQVGAGKDISLLGLSQDNVAVTIGGCRLFGGCPNRMDSPINHVSDRRDQSIRVVEGPFDVKHFGTFGGVLQFDKEQTFDNGVTLRSTYGSFDRRSNSFDASLSTTRDSLNLRFSKESLGMPEDGNGRSLGSYAPAAYLNRDQEWSVSEDLQLDYFFKANDKTSFRINGNSRDQDSTLFPARMMDGVYDNTRRIEVGMTQKFSENKEAKVSWFHNSVDHLMDNFSYRLVPVPMRMQSLTRATQSGARLEMTQGSLEYGFEDYSRYWRIGQGATQTLGADMTLQGLWLKKTLERDSHSLSFGMRLDQTESNDRLRMNPGQRSVVHNSTIDSRDEDLFSAFISLKRELNSNWSAFLDLGHGERPVDPMEYWFQRANWVGNPHLNAPEIDEVRLTFSKESGKTRPEFSMFRKDLDGHIYPAIRMVGVTRVRTFENIDAQIEGISLNVAHDISDRLKLVTNTVWQRGEKKTLPSLGTSKHLAEVPDITGRIELSYEKSKGTVRLFGEFASRDEDIDTDNGERTLGGYALWNIAYNRRINDNLELELRVDNLLDRQVVRHNAYDRDPVNQVVRLLPEAGRGVYVSLTHRF